MNAFIILSALMALLLFALALRPLWRAHRALMLALVVLSLAITAGLYTQFGSPDAIGFIAPAPPADLDDALTELEGVVATQPDNLEARILLARSYLQLGRYREAQVHLAESLKQQPGNAGLMVDYAEALLRAGKPEQPDPRVKQWIDKAVAAEPGNQRAVFFQGILLLQDGKAAEAAKTWEALLPQLDAATAQALLPQINAARQRAGLPDFALPESHGIRIRVELDPALKAQTPPGAVLFVFAKRADGAGPPVAAKRIALSAFPIQLQLSDADSVMPTEKLSAQDSIALTARVSASGTASAGAGDWQSQTLVLSSAQNEPVTLILRRQP